MAGQPVAQLPFVFRVAPQRRQREVQIQMADGRRPAAGERAAEGGGGGFPLLQLFQRVAEAVYSAASSGCLRSAART